LGLRGEAILIFMENFVEKLVEEYYKSKGYLVTTNYWIPFDMHKEGELLSYKARSWTDIDVLAYNEKELLIIQVKAIVNQKRIADKINVYFDRIDKFLKSGTSSDGETKINWWTKNKIVRKIVVYESYSPPAYLQIIVKEGIEVFWFKDYYLPKLIDHIIKKEGLKEDNATMRFLHCLNQYGFLNPIEK